MTVRNLVTLSATSLILLLSPGLMRAADHAESTSVAGDPAADLADVFAFVDPTDNTKIVLAMDVEGFVRELCTELQSG